MRWVFAFLVICYLALGSLVIWESHTISSDRAKAKRELVSVSLLNRFQRASLRMQVFLEKYHLTGERVWMERFGVERDMGEGIVQAIVKGDRDMGISPLFHREDGERFLRNWEEFIALADSAFAAGDTKKTGIYVTRASLRYEEMSQAAQRAATEIIAQENPSVLLPLVSLILALIIVALGLLAFVKMVVLPARRLASEAKRLAVGDLDAPVTMRAPGKLGQIAETLEEMRVNLTETREQVKRLIARRPPE